LEASLAPGQRGRILSGSLGLDEDGRVVQAEERIAREIEVVDPLVAQTFPCPFTEPRGDDQDGDIPSQIAERASQAPKKLIHAPGAEALLGLDGDGGVSPV